MQHKYFYKDKSIFILAIQTSCRKFLLNGNFFDYQNLYATYESVLSVSYSKNFKCEEIQNVLELKFVINSLHNSRALLANSRLRLRLIRDDVLYRWNFPDF
jgi:hypothetical protein